MAAYAALVSLNHIIDNLRLHSRPPITLHREQANLLTQKLTFLQEFLQVYNPSLYYSQEADPLESRIARAAYAAEDAIESHIFDRLTNDGENTRFDSLYQDLEKVIGDMALMEEEAMKIKETLLFQKAKSTAPADSSISSSSSIEKKKSMMVGADGLLLEMKSRLTSNARDLQTLPIVGMGGSGKTVLALNIYRDRLIQEHFDIRAWVNISLEYSIREILIQLLTQLIEKPNEEKPNEVLSEGELGEMLHKHLYGRKYMVILDDMWSLEAWDGVKRFLPNNKNGSGIVVTTRLTTLALALPNSNSLRMTLLSEDASWDLFSETVFGEKSCCPLELEDIGKKIVRACKGLPLSIAVIGGLLAKSKQAVESWKYVEENLSAVVNLEDDERCLKILYMSYKQLPVHLKPCFLYMGLYREDRVICIRDLVKLWVAEGFLKSVSGKQLEDVARAYIKDLSDRNLILIHKLGSIGSIKECKVHDLLRDLCLREAQKEGFYTVDPGDHPRDEVQDRVSRIIRSGTLTWEIEELQSLSSAPLARSLILNLNRTYLPPHVLRLLRILECSYNRSNLYLNNMHQLINLRFFSFTSIDTNFLSSIGLFWNVQTLKVDCDIYWHMFIAPTDIWYMSHIRHFYSGNFRLPDPPSNAKANGSVLENLQSLGIVHDFICSEQMVKTIPNVRKLQILYKEEVDDRFCLNNVDSLDKLESLTCFFDKSMCQINYPRSLKKLTVGVHDSQCWQDLLDKIGELPLLEKFKLIRGTFKGQWVTSEGQFRSLKFLYLNLCGRLRVWTLEGSHFPRLERLRLKGVKDLKKIPSDFADISTLRLIEVDRCCSSAVRSAKRILEEQEALYGEEDTTLQVQVRLRRLHDPALKSLGSLNFHVTVY